MCSAHQATDLVSCLLLPWLGEPWLLSHLLSVGNVLLGTLIIVTQRLGYPGAKKAESLALHTERKQHLGPGLVRDVLELLLFMELCRTSRGACLNGRSTWNLRISPKHTGPPDGIALQAQPSLHDWVLPQWIWIKLYLEKLCFNTCDGNSFLKNWFKITVVAFWKHPVAYPGGKVLSASEMWVVVLRLFTAFGCLPSVLIWCCYVRTPVNGCWWERNSQSFWSEFLSWKWKLEEKFLKRG